MHSHQRPTITRHVLRDGRLIATVKYEDNCEISFIAPRATRWNGGWPVFRGTDVGWGAPDIDMARREAFPEHR